MLIIDTRVSRNTAIAPDTYRLSFSASSIAGLAHPGQFIHLNIPDSGSIIRRPFSIYGVHRSSVTVAYRAVGTVTRNMALLKKGDILSVMGPIGNGFKVSGNYPVLVAGGTGLATLHFLKDALKPGILFFGARTKRQIWGVDEFIKTKWKVMLSTDDGTAGKKALVTDLFTSFLKQKAADKTYRVYTCGPLPMMRQTAALARQYGIEGEASLENVMACGVGACQGCVVEVKDKKNRYQRVCVDGPVFDLRQL